MKLHGLLDRVLPVAELSKREQTILNRNGSGNIVPRFVEDLHGLPLADCYQALLYEYDHLFDDEGLPIESTEANGTVERFVLGDISRIQHIQQKLARHGIALSLERRDSTG